MLPPKPERRATTEQMVETSVLDLMNSVNFYEPPEKKSPASVKEAWKTLAVPAFLGTLEYRTMQCQKLFGPEGSDTWRHFQLTREFPDYSPVFGYMDPDTVRVAQDAVRIAAEAGIPLFFEILDTGEIEFHHCIWGDDLDAVEFEVIDYVIHEAARRKQLRLAWGEYPCVFAVDQTKLRGADL